MASFMGAGHAARELNRSGMTVLAFATGTYVLRLVGHTCQTKGIAAQKPIKTGAWRQRALPDPIQPENRLGGRGNLEIAYDRGTFPGKKSKVKVLVCLC